MFFVPPLATNKAQGEGGGLATTTIISTTIPNGNSSGRFDHLRGDCCRDCEDCGWVVQRGFCPWCFDEKITRIHQNSQQKIRNLPWRVQHEILSWSWSYMNQYLGCLGSHKHQSFVERRHQGTFKVSFPSNDQLSNFRISIVISIL